MNALALSSGDTSNDLLFRLRLLQPEHSLNYRVVAQSDEEVRDIQNAPPISMAQFLVDTDQANLLKTLSIYSQRGTSRDRIRILYMNSVAFCLWEAMKKCPTVIGSQHRPPVTALLAFGVPFSE
jgi:hypothetical protein